MTSERLTTSGLASAIVGAERQKQNAFLQYMRDNSISEVQVVTLQLSTAQDEGRPYKIPFPFKSVYVEDTTAAGNSVNFRIGTEDTYQGKITLKRKDVLNFPHQVNGAFLDWSAGAASDTMKLVFLVSGNLRPGSQLIDINSNLDGDNYDQATPVSCTTTATEIVATNTSRGAVNLYNDGGSTVYIGNSSVTAVNGMPLSVGAYAVIRNTDEIYGITSAGTASIRITEEA